MFYVYGYSDPTSTDPFFYIGKGKKDRIREHLEPKIRRKYRSHFYHRLNKMLSEGREPIISILGESDNEEEMISLEISLIEQYGRLDLNNGPLCNHTDGGDGVTGHRHSDEAREKIRKKRAEQDMPWMSEAQKVQTSNSNREASKRPEVIAARRLGAINHRGRRIVAIDPLTGEIKHTFECIKDAAKKGYKNVASVLAGKRKMCRGYFWRDA